MKTLLLILLSTFHMFGSFAQTTEPDTVAMQLVDSVTMHLVVVDTESRVPVRDVLVWTDDNQSARTSWDGGLSLRDGFLHLTLRHPHYLERRMDRAEIVGDTIWLLPNMNNIGEVVVYGKDRRDELKRRWKMYSSPQQKRNELPTVVPPGPDLLALGKWIFGNTIGKMSKSRNKRKQAQKERMEREAEYERHYQELLPDSARK